MRSVAFVVRRRADDTRRQIEAAGAEISPHSTGQVGHDRDAVGGVAERVVAASLDPGGGSCGLPELDEDRRRRRRRG